MLFRNLLKIKTVITIIIVAELYSYAVEVLDSPPGSKVSVDSQFYQNSISGNKNLSSLNTGTFQTSILSMNHRQVFLDGYELEVFSNIRNTDDPIVDERNSHILQFYTRFGKPGRFNVELGDIQSNFSSYALSTGLEGAQGYFIFPSENEYYCKSQLVAGRTVRALSRKQYARYVTGIRVESGTKNGKHKTGFNYSRNWDEKGTLSSDELPQNDDLSPDKNQVYSLDFQSRNIRLWDIQNVNIDAEVARSRFDDNVEDSAIKDLEDWAARFSISGRIRKWIFMLKYERAGPDFKNNIASTSRDQEMYAFNLIYNAFHWLQMKFNDLYYRDNLDGQSDNTQRSNNPRLSILLKPVKNLSLETFYSRKDITSSLDNPDSCREIFVLSSIYDFKLANINISAEHEDFENEANPSNDLKRDSVSLGFKLKNQRITKDFSVLPSVSYSWTEEKSASEENEDRYSIFKIGIRMFYKRFMDGKLELSENFNERADSFNDSSKTAWLIELKARPGLLNNMEFGVRYEDRNYEFDYNPAREYREKKGTVFLNMTF